ncbi:hypothetical protein BC833DRAFT_577806 [Globomyces pollinis-pini]|nr:hypothetical protein BC833DRAFT_577806 [Globomyces pollinis-pini]
MSLTSQVSSGVVGQGADAWSNLAKTIRIATRGGMLAPPFAPGGLIIDVTGAMGYYLGAAIIIGILFLCLVFHLLGCTFQCFYLCCCFKRLKRKRKTSSTSCQKGCGIVWIVLIYLFFLIGAISSFTGGSQFTNAVQSLQYDTLNTVISAKDTISSFSPSISNTFDSIGGLINKSIDNVIASVDFDPLLAGGQVNANLVSLSTGLKNVAAQITPIITSGNSLGTAKDSLVTSLTTLVNTLTTFESQLSALGNSASPIQVGSITAHTYFFNQALPASTAASQGTTALNSMQNVPTGSAALSSLSSIPDLSGIASQIDTGVATLANVPNTVSDASSSAKGSIWTPLKGVKNNTLSGLSTSIGSVDQMFKEAILTLQSSFASGVTYQGYIGNGMLGFACLILFILLVFSIGFATKKARVVKGCNLISSPLFILIQIYAILFFILALVVGDVCTSVFEIKPSPLAQALPPAMGSQINQIIDIRDKCANNVSIVTIVGDMGLFDTSQFNISKLAAPQIDKLDITSLTSSLSDTSVGSGTDPTDNLNTLVNIDLSSLSTTSLTSIKDTTLPQLQTTINNLNTAIGQLVNPPDSFLTVNGGLNVATAKADFDSRIGTLQSTLTGLTPVITSITGNIDTMIADVTTIRTSITAIQGEATSIGTYYNGAIDGINTFKTGATTNVTASVTQLKLDILSGLDGIQLKLYSDLNCTAIGKNVIIIQKDLCGSFLGGLDSLWLAFAVLAIMGFLSMPALIYATNRLLAKYYIAVNPEMIGADLKGKQKSTGRVRDSSPEDDDDDDEQGGEKIY